MSAALQQLLRLSAWLALYAVILFGGWANFYIARRHQPLLWVAFGLLLLCLLPYLLKLLHGNSASAAAQKHGARSFDRAALLRELPETLAHFVPLLLFIALGPTIISAPTRAAPLRLPLTNESPFTRPQTGQKDSSADDSLSEPQPTEEGLPFGTALQPGHEPYIPPDPAGRPTGEATGSDGYSAATILELPFWDSAVSGERVELVAMFHRSTAGDWTAQVPDLKPGTPLAYRYLITCCVVDAMPVFAIIEGELPHDPPDEAWIRLRGRFKGMSTGFWSVPIIELDSIEETARPLDPYLMY